MSHTDHPQKRPKRAEASDMQLDQTPTKILQAASTGRGCHVFVSDNTELYIFMYYYVVHPHTQYRGTMLQQGF